MVLGEREVTRMSCVAAGADMLIFCAARLGQRQFGVSALPTTGASRPSSGKLTR